jgi:hypothetical protein
MKNLNQLVNIIKNNGIENAQLEFEQVHMELLPKVENLAQIFLMKDSYKFFNISKADLVSYATYEWLLKVISDWDGSTGTFEGFYFRYLTMGFVNAIKPYFTQKNQHHLVMHSTDIMVNVGDIKTPYIDTIQEEVIEEFTEDFGELIKKFGKEKGLEAKQIVLCLCAGNKSQVTDAICNVLGVTEYSPNVRKKVQRTKEAFKKFIGE